MDTCTIIAKNYVAQARTINPHAPAAMKTFWVDPTHEQPLSPETMLALCQLAGYAPAFVFCPTGSGDYERDRRTEGEYALVPRAPERHAGGQAGTASSRGAKRTSSGRSKRSAA